MRVVFFLGNKRSGTSYAVRVLNAHPEVFIAPEADIVWALYCREHGHPLEPHPDDGPRGLQNTLAGHRDTVISRNSVRDSFEVTLSALATRAGKDGRILTTIGDKKPVQQADPKLFEFALEHWPEARFLHLPRHPRAVVASMMDGAAGKLDFMAVWKRSADDLVDLWTRNEQRVIEHKAAGRARILTVPFHRLLKDPRSRWREILEFLDVEPHQNMHDAIESTKAGLDRKYADRSIPLTFEAAEIVRIYELQMAL